VHSWLKPCLVVYWLSLALWLAALAAAGLAAVHVFGRLPDTPMALDGFQAYPRDQHGTIAAGLVMADLFFTVDMIQFVVAPLALVTVGLQLTVFRLPARRPSNQVRLACLVLAAGLFAYHAVALAPTLNSNLRAYWQAAAEGDLQRATLHQEAFGATHETARLVLQANTLLVVAAMAASAVALGPKPARSEGLPEPELLKRT
jgi:hypothetical protein